MTIQNVFDQVSAAYEELEDKDSFEYANTSMRYNDGRMFAFSHVLELLYQLEEVEDERAGS
jgi:hypothetical protein